MNDQDESQKKPVSEASSVDSATDPGPAPTDPVSPAIPVVRRNLDDLAASAKVLSARDTLKGLQSPLAAASAALAAHGRLNAFQKDFTSAQNALNGLNNLSRLQAAALGMDKSLASQLAGKDLHSVFARVEAAARLVPNRSNLLATISEHAARTDLASISRTLPALGGVKMPTLSAIEQSLRGITNASQLLGDSHRLADISRSMATISGEMRRTQAALMAVTQPFDKVLASIREQRTDWASLATRSLTGAVAASLMATSPSAFASKSIFEMTALAGAVMKSTHDPLLWRQARDASFLVDGVSILNENDAQDYSDEVGIERILDALAERLEAASGGAEKPSQKLALISAIVGLLSLLAALVQIAQAHVYRMQDASQPDPMPEIVEIFDEQSVALNRIVTLLESETSVIPKVVAKRDANVRVGPDKTARKLTTLRPGDMAVFLESADGWTLIEIANPLTNHVTTGWVYSKLIAKVD